LVAAAFRALASDESAGDLLNAVAASAAPDTVLQAMRRVREEVPLSSHALHLLHALSSVAASQGARQVEAPEPALLAELSVLFLADDVDRYNPEDHKQLLTNAALDVPTSPEGAVDVGDRITTLTDDAVADHMADASIEMLLRLGGREGTDVLLSRLEGLFRDCVSRGRLEAAVTLAEDLKALGDAHASAAAVQAQVDQTIGRLATAESVRAILEALHRRGAHSASLARRLLDALGASAARGFLIALAEEPDKSRRRRILDLLVSIGPVIAGPATELLGDARWYVVRNMVVLLHRVADRSALAEVRLCVAHPDLRVRLAAIKYLLAHDPEVPRDLLARAIHDPDPKMAETAVTLAGNYGIKEAVTPLLEVVADWDVFGRRRSIRVKALKALGELADPVALPRLERFFRDWLVPLVSLDERRTAYRSLQTYPAEARTALVERGLRSRDEEIRRICLHLIRVGSVEPSSSSQA
ncbi:MAG TPA: HEAT repeat domain-containing protein, partial [Vicinamibacteria bacterium]|nr:HEAT repeat domain-containing protein [Vicinamibacteria bacterium]